MSHSIPATAQAVQLTGPDSLELNPAKPVPKPEPHQLLLKVEATGLCYSDLKLLKQFDTHVRKTEVISGIDTSILPQIPSYVPGKKPTVPGHEAVVRVVSAGPETRHPVGDLFLVQADYRWLLTESNNGAFGYDFEGALQEYVLVDERVITSPEGDSMLLPVKADLSLSAIGLVEPWACVEDAYVSPERLTAKSGGRMLVVVDEHHAAKGVENSFSPDGPPQSITWVAPGGVAPQIAGCETKGVASLDEVGSKPFDDIIYFGATPETIENLNDRIGAHGLFNIVLGGKKIGRDVEISVGRVHYGGIRFTGTASDDAAQGLLAIPATPEVRPGEKALMIGAAGPMGVMHVIRVLCQGVPNVEVIASDFDDERLRSLDAKAEPLAKANSLKYCSINPQKDKNPVEASYVVLMAPVAALVANAVKTSLPKAIINIFAGIPATVKHPIDIDRYIDKGMYFIGTSGSSLDDMKIVLAKVVEGSLDTNVSVAAVSGMAGAIDGIRAVENRTIAGKIIVYPVLHELGLTPLEDLEEKYPSVHAKLRDGHWTKEAEREFLKVARI